jgi:predicted DNA-binding transcriptional regulator AlpA
VSRHAEKWFVVRAAVSYVRHMPQNRQNPITATEVATILGIDPRTVQRRAAKGTLPSTGKLPGRTGPYLFDPEVIDQLALKVAA